MNSSPKINMSPNTFRRLLVAHGRMTTPGVFDANEASKSEEVIKDVELTKKKSEFIIKEKVDVLDKESQNTKPTPVESEHRVADVFGEHHWPRKEAMMNPPLSKSKSTKPSVASSYSFYTRPFKVHGREAWEFAMRGLGSVDTLMNRYGYVEPMWRGETFPTPLEMQQKDFAEKKRG